VVSGHNELQHAKRPAPGKRVPDEAPGVPGRVTAIPARPPTTTGIAAQILRSAGGAAKHLERALPRLFVAQTDGKALERWEIEEHRAALRRFVEAMNQLDVIPSDQLPAKMRKELGELDLTRERIVPQIMDLLDYQDELTTPANQRRPKHWHQPQSGSRI
jgi:hypothetical protein